MDLCHHRPLFSVCAAYIAAMALGSMPAARWLWILGGLLLVIGLLSSGWLFRRKRRAAWLAVALSLAGALAFATCLCTFHGEDERRARARFGEEVTVIGTVTDCRGSGGYMTSFEVDVDTLDGAPCDGRYLLICHYVSDLKPGHRVSLTAMLRSTDTAAEEGFDPSALRGDGLRAMLLSESEDEVAVLSEDAGGAAVAMGKWRRRLSARLEVLCGRKAAGLPSALLLGERRALTDAVRRDFARAGVSHILSISGMHVTLLFGILGGLLAIPGIPKRVRVILPGIVAVGYLALIGFLPSATRAVVMLGMVYLAALMRGRADSLTSLGLAGAIILAVDPFAVYDVGFWMSMTATLGLVVYAPMLRVKTPAGAPLWRRGLGALKKLAGVLFIGALAMSCSLLPVAMVMGEVGILSPIATLLLTPLTAVILVASPLALLTAGTPLSGFFGEVSALAGEHMAKIAAVLARPGWVVVSLRHPAVLPVVVGTVAVAAILLVIRLPRRLRWATVTPLLTGWVILGIILGGHAVREANDLRVTYLQPSSQADMLVLVNGRDSVICDASNGSLSSMTTAVREAKANGATELSAILLSHYHTATSGMLSRILARETVRALWLPMPTSREDYDRLLACIEAADKAGVPVTVYEPGAPLRLFGEATVRVETARVSRSTQPVLLLSLDTADDRLVYCGSAVFESPLSDAARAAVGGADTVIFGHHGPLTKKAFGQDIPYAEHALVILSAEGDEAGYFEPGGLPPDAAMWYGQRRIRVALK